MTRDLPREGAAPPQRFRSLTPTQLPINLILVSALDALLAVSEHVRNWGADMDGSGADWLTNLGALVSQIGETVGTGLTENLVGTAAATIVAAAVTFIVGRLVMLRVALRSFVQGVATRKRAGSVVIAIVPFVNDKTGSLQRSVMSRLETEFHALGALVNNRAIEVLTVPFQVTPDETGRTRKRDIDRVSAVLDRSGADLAIWGWQVRGEAVANIYFLASNYRSIPQQVNFENEEAQAEFDAALAVAIALVLAEQSKSLLRSPQAAKIEVLRAVSEKVRSIIEHQAPALNGPDWRAQLEPINLALQNELALRTDRLPELESAIATLRKAREGLEPNSEAWAENVVDTAELISAQGWRVNDFRAFHDAFYEVVSVVETEGVKPALRDRAMLAAAVLYDRAELFKQGSVPDREEFYRQLIGMTDTAHVRQGIRYALYTNWALTREPGQLTLEPLLNPVLTTKDGRLKPIETALLYFASARLTFLTLEQDDPALARKLLSQLDRADEMAHPNFLDHFKISRLALLSYLCDAEGVDADDLKAFKVARRNVCQDILASVNTEAPIDGYGHYHLLKELVHAISGGDTLTATEFDEALDLSGRVVDYARQNRPADVPWRLTTMAVLANNAGWTTGERRYPEIALKAIDESLDLLGTPTFHAGYVRAYALVVLAEKSPGQPDLVIQAREQLLNLEEVKDGADVKNRRYYRYLINRFNALVGDDPALVLTNIFESSSDAWMEVEGIAFEPPQDLIVTYESHEFKSD